MWEPSLSLGSELSSSSSYRPRRSLRVNNEMVDERQKEKVLLHCFLSGLFLVSYFELAGSAATPYLTPTQYPSVQRCSSGAPLQWRPYLDAASKAYLAPVVVLGTLKQLNLTPIQLTQQTRQQQHQSQQQIAYHPQNINNAGVNIEATFAVSAILKKRLEPPMAIKLMQTIKLIYKVSASLSTTHALMKLANSNLLNSSSNSSNSNEANSNLFPLNQSQHQSREAQIKMPTCALDLSEHELVKKAGKIFKMNKRYVIFLEQSSLLSQRHFQQAPSTQLNFNLNQYQNNQNKKQQQVGAVNSFSLTNDLFLHPFATHELLTNRTSRAISKILGQSSAQVPQVQLLNSTFVSGPTQKVVHGGRSQPGEELERAQTQRRPMRLDCRVTGYPLPWVEWFRNGKLLRNRPGWLEIKTSRWRKRHNVSLSRLEITPQAGKNETGVYECRAMNVVAREPVVGAYTLLVLPTNYAIIPMQPALVASPDLDQDQEEDSASSSHSGSPSFNSNSNSNSSSSSSSRHNRHSSNNTQTIPTTTNAAVTPTTVKPTNSAPGSPTTPTSEPRPSKGPREDPTGPHPNSIQRGPVPPATVIGQACPREANDNFCLHKGTCVLIGQIAEYFCNCAEGYHGHRCEYKSLGHQLTV